MTAPLVQIDPDHPTPRRIAQAVALLANEGIVVYPTDTSYGIGCDLLSKKAIDRLYGIRARDPRRPMTFLCANLSQAAQYAQITDQVYRLVRRLTPGPYTLILKATREVPKVVTTKQKTVGVRIPDGAVVQALLEGLGRPILNTTANDPDGQLIVDPREIRDAYGETVDLILDPGLNLLDVSTVLDLTGDEPVVVREGKGPVEDL